MNKSLNVFLIVLLCFVLYAGVLTSLYTTDDSASQHYQTEYTSSIPTGIGAPSVSFGVGARGNDLTVSMSSRPSRGSVRHLSSHRLVTSSPNSLITSSPNSLIASSPNTAWRRCQWSRSAFGIDLHVWKFPLWPTCHRLCQCHLLLSLCRLAYLVFAGYVDASQQTDVVYGKAWYGFHCSIKFLMVMIRGTLWWHRMNGRPFRPRSWCIVPNGFRLLEYRWWYGNWWMVPYIYGILGQ